MIRRIVLLLSLFLPIAGCHSSKESAQVQRLRPMLTYLASDELEGRGLKTQGINKAASYIRHHFKAAGLEPLPGLENYFQDFKITVEVRSGAATNLRSGERVYKLNRDYNPFPLSAEGSFDAPVVFAGYAAANAEHEYDDFAGVDLKGKVVLALRYEPHNPSGGSRFQEHGFSDAAGLMNKAKAVAHLGGVALLIVNPPNHHGREDLSVPSGRSQDKADIPVLMISQEIANDLLQAGGAKDLTALQEQIDASVKPASQDLKGAQLAGTVEMQKVQRNVRNVVAYLPGTGTQRDEYIVVGAHYDHLGLGEAGSLAPHRNQIHNGADDNASGTVAIIQAAELLARQGPLNRSIIFIAFTGEEQGLLGSDHFVKHSPVPIENVAYMINLDMVGRVRKSTLYVAGDGTAQGLDAVVKAADSESKLRLKTAGGDLGSRGGIGPSDHTSFALKKIPVLCFFSGVHADYHTPNDDVEKINFKGIARAVDLTVDLVRRLDQLPKQAYVEAFDRAMPRGGEGSRVQLGIMPNYSQEDVKGVLIDGAMPDTPAAAAGLRAGDILIQMGEVKLASLPDLSDALRKHKPDEVVKIVYLRKGGKKEVDVTLAQRK